MHDMNQVALSTDHEKQSLPSQRVFDTNSPPKTFEARFDCYYYKILVHARWILCIVPSASIRTSKVYARSNTHY